MGRSLRMLVGLAVLSAIGLPTFAHAQPPEVGPGETRQPSRVPSRPPRGPVVVDSPGDVQSAIIPPANYVSPFASIFSGNSESSSSSALSNYYRSTERSRLLRMPEMFGDFRRGGPMIVVTPTTGVVPSLGTELPFAAAISGLRAAENNQALPADRFWVAYNYFSNAIDTTTDGSFGLTPTSRSQSLHRSVVATEILLDCGGTSLEVRMPFGAAFGERGVGGLGGATTPFGVEAESVGNLNLLLKRLVYADGGRACSIGVGVELPTGSTATVTYGDILATLEPEAVHLVPFFAWTERHGRWFGHMFAQVDVATHGDPLRATLVLAGPLTHVGRINQQTLLGIDLGVGYWLIPECRCRLGLAVVAEAHYTAPLNSDDRFTASGSQTAVTINAPIGASSEVFNFTTGIQLSSWHGWALRSGFVFPARDEKVFDAEYILQVNRTF